MGWLALGYMTFVGFNAILVRFPTQHSVEITNTLIMEAYDKMRELKRQSEEMIEHFLHIFIAFWPISVCYVPESLSYNPADSSHRNHTHASKNPTRISAIYTCRTPPELSQCSEAARWGVEKE